MEKKEVEFESDKHTLLAKIQTELDHHTAKRIRESIDERIFLEKPETLILDFSGVRFMDSSGIALILGRVEVTRSQGGNVRLIGLCENLYKLVRLSGIEKIHGITVMK